MVESLAVTLKLGVLGHIRLQPRIKRVRFTVIAMLPGSADPCLTGECPQNTFPNCGAAQKQNAGTSMPHTTGNDFEWEKCVPDLADRSPCRTGSANLGHGVRVVRRRLAVDVRRAGLPGAVLAGLIHNCSIRGAQHAC